MDAASSRGRGVKKIDLHCHSRASTEADEAVLLAIGCPESYSAPEDVYKMAKDRGMDFVTITDHDSIAGVIELNDRPDVIVGEELTCYFPEDHCKIHLLIWGITAADHDALQEVAFDIYQVAQRVAERNIAHAVAHPLYRQNDKLDRWHVERLLLLFNGFECLNGAHSATHRKAFEPMLDELDVQQIIRLERVHGMIALGSDPWRKARTAGSDDHGLFNIGRTWTEFPDDVRTRDDVIQALRDGRCCPAGEAGSSIKLAHNFYGVGIRYYLNNLSRNRRSLKSAVLQRMVGESARIPILGVVAAGAKSVVGKAARRLGLGRPARGTKLLGHLLASSGRKQLSNHRELLDAFRHGKPPLAEHAMMFSMVSALSRDTTAGIADAIAGALSQGQLGDIFDAVSAVLAQQAILLPYYFALFHQNQERELLHQLSHRRLSDKLRVGFFTDSPDDNSFAATFARELSRADTASDITVAVNSCTATPNPANATDRIFTPLWIGTISQWHEPVVVPPVLEVLQFADERQFDLIVVNSCGPMALCGLLAAKMLRIPVIATCPDDLAARVFTGTNGDYRLTSIARSYGEWFFDQATRIQCSDLEAFVHECRKASGRTSDFMAEEPIDDPLMEVAV
ncbi:MAG TPA: PHP-associated domain-containing protein [Tepidisphaeraceae bacterium]|nr:PHP-associated domain-containing protein [Tepidisphaeraceae bacterium]